MQYGENLYLNVEVVGYDTKNFLSFTDIRKFQIVETAGASLPYIYMSFITRDTKTKDYFQEGNRVKVTIGNTIENADTFEFYIHIASADKDGSGVGWKVEFTGFVQNRYYMIDKKNKAYVGNSLLVVNSVMKEYFGIEAKKEEDKTAEITSAYNSAKSSLSNAISSGINLNTSNLSNYSLKTSSIPSLSSFSSSTEQKVKYYINTDFTKVNEEQIYWRRNNLSACSFVAETLLHMDVRPSFPLFAFDKYGNFYVKDLNKLIAKGPSYIFTSMKPTSTNTIQYYNNFNVDSFKDMYNLYSGYNKLTEVYGTVSGLSGEEMADNEPVLAATSEAEKIYSGNMISMNKIQTSNVHKNYWAAYAHNTNKLMALSSMLGAVCLLGNYYKQLKPLDLVYINPDGNADYTISGNYLIDSIVTEADFGSGAIRTYVYVTRDNKNSVEDYIAEKKDWLNIAKRWRNDILNTVSRIRTVYAKALQFVDGTYMNKVLSFAVATKNNLLRSFSVAGVIEDFTSKANALTSLIATGNALMNSLVDMIFPAEIAAVFRDFIVRKPSMIGVFSSYVAEYVPFELREIIMSLAESIYGTTDSLNSIAKDNGISGVNAIQPEGENTMAETSETNYITESQQKVNNIISSFEDNTTGLDIPFPIIEVDESTALLPDEKLQEYVATKTIDNLTDLGYMTDVDVDKFKRILLGQEAIDFAIIEQINNNAGNTYNYRFWGTYTDLVELTSFIIRKSYKDKYRTIPCTKFVSALANSKIFFACPKSEEDLKFYINSKRIELESFDIDLGYTDIYGVKIPYKVYYTENGFNSNSVMLEVKKGGMV